jgi:hypothetical protein
MGLKEVKLKLNLGKCEFAKSKLTFLGHVVSNDKTQPNKLKIRTIINFLIPTSITNVWVFLGLKGYYMNYMKGYSCIAIPLFDLTKKDYVFKWNFNC